MRQYLTKKNIIQALLFVILLAAIPIGLSLVKQQQTIKSKASTANIIFGGPNVKLVGGKLIAVDTQIKVKVVAAGSGQSSNNGLVKRVYAQSGARCYSCRICNAGQPCYYTSGCENEAPAPAPYTDSSSPSYCSCSRNCSAVPAATAAPTAAPAAAPAAAPTAGVPAGSQPVTACGQTCNSVLSSDSRVRSPSDCQTLDPHYVANIGNSGGVCTISCGDCRNNRTGRTLGSGCDCVSECQPNNSYDYDQNRCVPDVVLSRPSQSPSVGVGATGQVIPTAVTINKFKVTDESAATDVDNPIWEFIPSHNYSSVANAENTADFTFTPKVCITQPCDPYPREDRLVFVQFLGAGVNNTPFKQVVSAPITLALKPKITSASCQPSSSGTGTAITIKGLHFGSTAGLVTAGGQNTDPSLTVWGNLQITANLATPLVDQKDIAVATEDGQVTDPVSCASGKSKVDFKALLSCRTVDKPLSVAELEIKDLGSVGIGSTSSSAAVSFYRNTKESFDEEGRPQGVLSKELEEGRNYSLSVKAAGALRKTVKFTATQGATVLENITLPLGDLSPAKGDNQVNAFDRTELLQQWGKGSDKGADYNQDSWVNTSDLSCLMSNYGQTGDKP